MKFTYITSLIYILFIAAPGGLYAANLPMRKHAAENYTGFLSGKVTENGSGRALAGATVYINDLKLGIITDTAGHYSFKNLPSGRFLIEVRYVGFKAVTRSIAINGVVVENFELSRNIVEESEVVVTGLSGATQARRSPIPIVSISQKSMASNINTNIIDAITKVPGVTAVTTGPNISKPYIRGLGFNRILTLYDGMRQEGQQWGDEHGIEVDQYSINRVEVVKGPASLSYGSDALAGVVNMIPTQPAPEGKLIGELVSEYHTNNGLFAGSAMLGGTKNGFEWMGRLSHKQATNYRNQIDGRVYGTAFNETDATAYLGLHRKWGYSHVSLSMFNDLQEIPDGSRDVAGRFTRQITEADTVRPVVADQDLSSYKIADIHQHVRHYRVFSNNSFTLGSGRLVVNAGFQKSIRQEFSHPQTPTIAGLYLDMDTYNYDMKYIFPELGGWDLSLGLNGMYQENKVEKGTEYVIPSYHQFDAGPFFLVKKSFEKIDISGGLRYDSRSFSSNQLYTKPNPSTGYDMPVADTTGANYRFSNMSHTYQGVSGSVGFTYNATDKISLKANVARGYRAPNISEISANGVHPGTNIYQIGGQNFRPEFSLQEDVGFVYASQYVVINFSLFNNTIQDYIYNQRLLSASGADSVIVAGNQTYQFQQGKADLYGGELNIDFHPIKPLHFENSLSYVNGINRSAANGKGLNDSSKYLPFVPPFHGLSELRYDFESKAAHLSNCFAKAQLVYYAAQNHVYLTDNTETPTPGYALLNLGIGSDIVNKRGKAIFNLSIMANNVFNIAYFDHLSRLKYFYYSSSDTNPAHGIHNMGRNIAFRLNIPLSFSTR